MFAKMMEMVNAMVAVEDADFDFYGGMYHLCFIDFVGFDENWSEVMRDFADEAMVDRWFDWANAHAQAVEGDYYRVYHFDGFDVQVGFASYDI